jgi:hypothetical protein
MELYLHSLVGLHAVTLKYLNTGTIALIIGYRDDFLVDKAAGP